MNETTRNLTKEVLEKNGFEYSFGFSTWHDDTFKVCTPM